MNIYRVFMDGIFAREDWFLEALGQIEPDQISDLKVRAIYKILRFEYYKGGNPPDIRTFPDLVARKCDEKVAQVLTEYVLSSEHNIPDRPVFRHAVQMVLQDGYTEKVRENITKATAMLSKKMLQGIGDVLVDGLESYETGGSREVSARAAVMDVVRAQDAKSSPGIPTGLPQLDASMGGIRPGDLLIWGAFTSEGKTSFMMEMAYHMIIQGHNVGWVTIEMEADEMEEIFLTRHAHKFVEGGLDATAIQQHLLEPDELEAFKVAAMDWRDNPDYGRLQIWKPHRAATLRSVEAKVKSWKSAYGIEVFILDYLEPIAATSMRQDYRIEIKEKAALLKRVASDLGVGAITGHQINRAGRDKAEKRGYYILKDLAESSGIEQNAKTVCYSLLTDAMEEAGEIKWGVIKQRRGQKFRHGFMVPARFDRGRIYIEGDSPEAVTRDEAIPF